MSKQIEFNSDARAKLKAGVDALANAVRTTLGPKGRNVVIGKKFGSPHVTKDGVTVAKEIELSDPIENLGAQMVKEVASKTADIAGDGTTTATVLAQQLVAGGLKVIEAGSNPIDVKRGMDKAAAAVVAELKSLSQEVGVDNDKIKQVATISANNDDAIGGLIAEAMRVVGKDGVVGGRAGKNLADLVKTAKANGLDLNKAFGGQVQNWIQNIEQGESVDTYKQIIRSVAKLGLPDKVGGLLDQGVDLDTIYSPYRRQMASLLEVDEDAISLDDPLLRSAIGPDKEQTLYDYKKMIRKLRLNP